MNIADVAFGAREFTITWDDHSEAEFPFVWLRDNDPDELHPHTRERVFDLTTIALDIRPVSFALEESGLRIHWPNRETASVYSQEWMQAHQPGRTRNDPSKVRRRLWNAAALGDIPRFDAASCMASDASLVEALLALKVFGLIIIEQLEDSPTAGEAFGDLIGFKRETNFGTVFEVLSKPEPNNLAYTSMALPLHTDLPNQELVPGYQFLHCYRNSATGGESVFADGFSICEDLREYSPEDFELLCRVRAPWRFHDMSCDIRQHRPIISQDENGGLSCFVFNAHIADVPDMPAKVLREFYGAYRNLMLRVRDSTYSIRHALVPGEMIVFDNARVLHGRTAFDQDSGERHLRGYYEERNEVDSRIRVLKADT